MNKVQVLVNHVSDIKTHVEVANALQQQEEKKESSFDSGLHIHKSFDDIWNDLSSSLSQMVADTANLGPRRWMIKAED